MDEYHKINTIFKRDMAGDKRLIPGDWSQPEFEYLADNRWEFTEKVDGTNIRIGWDGLEPNHFHDTPAVQFAGRTDSADIPGPLREFLEGKFTFDHFWNCFPDWSAGNDMTLYGEGYGPKIQSGGKYRGDHSFVLFDVKIGNWWLRRDDVNDIAAKLGIDSVPVIGYGTLHDAVNLVKQGLWSSWGQFEAEGIVARPAVPLFDRGGKRIIAKIKGRDFK